MIEKGDVVTLDNNKEYVVFGLLNYNNGQYVFLIDKEKDIDIKICLLNGEYLIPVEDLELIKNLINIFYEA